MVNGQTLFYVKGTGLGPATWQWCQGATCGGDIPFSVVTISSLEFVDIDSPVVSNNNPNTGGGKRIYPDKTSPSDTTNRKRVRVKATLSAAINAMSVYFKSFDLDDPSSDSSPVDTNGSSGDDNRAASNKSGILAPANQTGSSNTLTLVTSPQGVAEADLTVTMNPGDNFMAAASGDPNIVSGIQIDGITLKDSGNNTLPVTKAKNTPMLTVWRKLHIEVDNMGAIGTNSQSGTVTAAVHQGAQTVVTLSVTPDADRYIPGTIKIHNTNYAVQSYTGNQLTINGNPNLNQINNKNFTIWDDDDYDSDNNPDNGDESETSITSLNAFTKLQATDNASTNVYLPAYIMPVYDGGGGAFNGSANGNVNIATAVIALNRINAHRGSVGSDEFWVSYFQVGYQGAALKDMDPDSEFGDIELGMTPSLGFANTITGCSGTPAGAVGSIIYQETQRDLFADLSESNDDLTVPHELGHQFGLDGDTDGWGLMGVDTNDAEIKPDHLHIIRCRVKSPGL